MFHTTLSPILIALFVAIVNCHSACFDIFGASQCAGVASANMCGQQFALRNCQKTCQLCTPPVTCLDTDLPTSCNARSCNTKEDFVECPVTCQACVPNDGISCWDVATNCTDYISDCYAFPAYSREVCMKSCGHCQTTLSTPSNNGNGSCNKMVSNGKICCGKNCDDCACNESSPCPSGKCRNFCLGNAPSRYCV